MIYEVRVNQFMGVGSKSLDIFYKDIESANEKSDRLNTMMQMYFVEKIKLEDEEIAEPEIFDKVYEIRSSNFGKAGTSSLTKPQFFKNKEKAEETVNRLNTYMHCYSLREVPLA